MELSLFCRMEFEALYIYSKFNYYRNTAIAKLSSYSTHPVLLVDDSMWITTVNRDELLSISNKQTSSRLNARENVIFIIYIFIYIIKFWITYDIIYEIIWPCKEIKFVVFTIISAMTNFVINYSYMCFAQYEIIILKYFKSHWIIKTQ